MVVTNEANGTDAFHFYEDAEWKSGRDVKYLTGFMLGNITFGGYTAVLINALHQIFILKNYDASDWFLPYNTLWVFPAADSVKIIKYHRNPTISALWSIGAPFTVSS